MRLWHAALLEPEQSRAATRDAGGARPLTHADPAVLMSAVLTSY